MWTKAGWRLGALDSSMNHEADVFVVGLYVDRFPAIVVGALAILTAGGAYLPLDPAHPKERVEFLSKDAGVPIVVTLECMVADLPVGPQHVFSLNHEGHVAAGVL
jgi:non-ribosomal peptide synthetase component F